MSGRDFAAALRGLEYDPLAARVLAELDETALPGIAQTLAATNAYGEHERLAAAAARLGLGRDAIPGVLAHQLWCAWRQARWKTGRVDAATATRMVRLEGDEHVRETMGHPTIVIAPMTVGLADAGMVIHHALETMAPGRPLIIYGEDVETADMAMPREDMVAGSGLEAVWRISDALAKGGIFCTYPDFVYGGHASTPVRLLGGERPLSSSFIALAARRSTMLLPCLIRREGDALLCSFDEPTRVEDDPDLKKMDAKAARQLRLSVVGDFIAQVLEQQILRAGTQWLLLQTLTYDAPQMALAR